MAVQPRDLDERCATCGFAWAQLSPPVDLVHRRQPSGWSIVGLGAHVAEVLERKAAALAAVRDHHRPVLPSADIEAPHPSDDRADPADVAGDVAGAAEMLARTIESISGTDWMRVGIQADRDVTAAHLARDAVHEAAHHLRAAALAAARPRDEDQVEGEEG